MYRTATDLEAIEVSTGIFVAVATLDEATTNVNIPVNVPGIGPGRLAMTELDALKRRMWDQGYQVVLDRVLPDADKVVTIFTQRPLDD